MNSQKAADVLRFLCPFQPQDKCGRGKARKKRWLLRVNFRPALVRKHRRNCSGMVKRVGDWRTTHNVPRQREWSIGWFGAQESARSPARRGRCYIPANSPKFHRKLIAKRVQMV